VRFVIFNTDYPAFVDQLYRNNPGLENRRYDEQLHVRFETFFGLNDFYTHALRALGHEAFDIYGNLLGAQTAWTREHGIPLELGRKRRFILRRGILPGIVVEDDLETMVKVVAHQLDDMRPDAFLNQATDVLLPSRVASWRPRVKYFMGQHAAMPLSDREDWRIYDLMISSFPPTVDWLRPRARRAELNRLAFEPRVLERLGACPKKYPLTFIGSFYPVHLPRTQMLEELAKKFPLKVWGPSKPNALRWPALSRCYQGEAWGLDMFRILASSVVTLNHHGAVLPAANNMRLFEATGVGTLLVTDWKSNLSEMFSDSEVAAYRSTEECAERVRYYLDHDREREDMAAAGQRRTLAEHTYFHRMKELVGYVESLS
jgi:spore maturation protein CgeB